MMEDEQQPKINSPRAALAGLVLSIRVGEGIVFPDGSLVIMERAPQGGQWARLRVVAPKHIPVKRLSYEAVMELVRKKIAERSP